MRLGPLVSQGRGRGRRVATGSAEGPASPWAPPAGTLTRPRSSGAGDGRGCPLQGARTRVEGGLWPRGGRGRPEGCGGHGGPLSSGGKGRCVPRSEGGWACRAWPAWRPGCWMVPRALGLLPQIVLTQGTAPLKVPRKLQGPQHGGRGPRHPAPAVTPASIGAGHTVAALPDITAAAPPAPLLGLPDSYPATSRLDRPSPCPPQPPRGLLGAGQAPSRDADACERGARTAGQDAGRRPRACVRAWQRPAWLRSAGPRHSRGRVPAGGAAGAAGSHGGTDGASTRRETHPAPASSPSRLLLTVAHFGSIKALIWERHDPPRPQPSSPFSSVCQGLPLGGL